MAIVNVNNFLTRVESTDLKIDAIRSRELYKDASFLRPAVLNCIRRFETNVKVVAKKGDSLYISDFSLFDKEELDFIQRNSQKFKYIHVGAVLVAIRAMYPGFRGTGGSIVIYDGSCIDRDRKKSFICAQNFSFDSDTCYFLFRPEHIMSTSDPHLGKAFSFKIELDCPKYLEDRELVAMDIGTAYRTTNSARFLDTCSGNSGWVSQAILNCQALEFNEGVLELMDKPIVPLLFGGERSNLLVSKRRFGPDKVRRSRSVTASSGGRRNFRSSSGRIENKLFLPRSSFSEAESSRSKFQIENESESKNSGREKEGGFDVPVDKLSAGRGEDST
uniref:MP n=1 Tax=Avellana capillovirus 1 TaxID=2794427 RepID=A0A7T5QZA0_9VIRU|nr:MP [Avellana capillovirus 1]